MLTDVGPVELWATRQRRPSAAANPQGSLHGNSWKSRSRHWPAGSACRPDAQSQDQPWWFRIPSGARLLGAIPSGGAAVFAAVRPGIYRGTESATALTARAMYATVLLETILAARPSLLQMGPAAAAIANASPWLRWLDVPHPLAMPCAAPRGIASMLGSWVSRSPRTRAYPRYRRAAAGAHGSPSVGELDLSWRAALVLARAPPRSFVGLPSAADRVSQGDDSAS